jgi:hypothetical protein
LDRDVRGRRAVFFLADRRRKSVRVKLPALADGRVALRFKRPLSDGAGPVVFTPFELIERLVPLGGASP